jgi:YD repeat-containing protein
VSTPPARSVAKSPSHSTWRHLTRYSFFRLALFALSGKPHQPTERRYGRVVKNAGLSRTTSCDPECHGEVEAGTTTYVYDVNDRLLEETGSDGVTLYQYDLNGNTISRISPDGTVDYHYNPHDRLIRATGDLESGATESIYTYDEPSNQPKNLGSALHRRGKGAGCIHPTAPGRAGRRLLREIENVLVHGKSMYPKSRSAYVR